MRNNTLLFLVLFSLTLVLSFFSRELLNTDDLLVKSLAERFTAEQMYDFIDAREKWQWLGYIVFIIPLLLKISIIAVVLDVGCFFFGKEIKYSELFNIVVKAEFVFLLATVFKIAWFYFFQTNYSLEDLQYFYPLSILNIIGYEDLQPWFIYPLQVFNLFELAYWAILAYLIGKETNEDMDKGLSIVASSYGVVLLIWVVGVMFLTLNLS